MSGIYSSEVLMQLFVQGPTWDGNLVSKEERNSLVEAGFAERWNGWNYLTQEGVEAAVAGGLAARDWHDGRWFKKAACHG
ncbi:hypothetical protein SAMN04244548_02987 [Paracoccus pantotrophus]|nr:hypothetical protein SAMN04244548_02987 [Paracoccus pantotrophus]